MRQVTTLLPCAGKLRWVGDVEDDQRLCVR
jgi:hypothetical protein